MAKSGYRVSFLEPTDRGDGDARAWKVTTEKRWTVAGAKVGVGPGAGLPNQGSELLTGYPLVICYIAIEHGQRNSEFSH